MGRWRGYHCLYLKCLRSLSLSLSLTPAPVVSAGHAGVVGVRDLEEELLLLRGGGGGRGITGGGHADGSRGGRKDG